MLPIQFIFLLIVVTLPGQLAEVAQASGGGGDDGMRMLRHMPAWAGFVSLWGIHLLLMVWAVIGARRAMGRLHDPLALSTPVASHTDRLFSSLRWVTTVVTAAHLLCTPMAHVTLGWFEGTRVLKYLLVPEMLFMLPAVATWVVIWTAGYYLEMAIREKRMAYQLAQAQPVHEMPGVGSYLWMQMRHNMFPLVFLLFKTATRLVALVLGRWFATQIQGAGTDVTWADAISMVACSLLFITILPAMLMRIWSTTPLTGPLRERLDAVARQYGVKFRQILLWRSHNMVINAAILGWLPRYRYFLMSDALVETLTDEQLEAVFAHEVGHGAHRHIWWLMAMMLSCFGIASGAAAVAAYFVPGTQATSDMISLVLSSGLMLAAAGWAIRAISPRFEHQADWFAARHMALRFKDLGPAAWKASGVSVMGNADGGMLNAEGVAVNGQGGRGHAESVVRRAKEEMQRALEVSGFAALEDMASQMAFGLEGMSIAQYRAGAYPHAAQEAQAGVTKHEDTKHTKSHEVVEGNIDGNIDAKMEGKRDDNGDARFIEREDVKDGCDVKAECVMTAEMAGAEMFISALDAIVDSAHKDRERRGWFHPSVNARAALLRKLATEPESEARFNRRQIGVRWCIVGLILAGVGLGAVCGLVPEKARGASGQAVVGK